VSATRVRRGIPWRDRPRTRSGFGEGHDAWSDGVDTNAPRPRFTDPNRDEMWEPNAARAYNAYGDDYEWDFQHFQAPGGYVNVPLDGIWIRAPYLHNGSVPYLAELFEPREKRTSVFYRGLDIYDPQRMGFVSEGQEAQRVGTRYDTAARGNSNQGHYWGVDLSAEQKRVLLLEFLKTQ
jgi:RoxA-like, cytochrome c-like